jgi:hypothetical protein
MAMPAKSSSVGVRSTVSTSSYFADGRGLKLHQQRMRTEASKNWPCPAGRLEQLVAGSVENTTIVLPPLPSA